jgi:hypothetical protein
MAISDVPTYIVNDFSAEELKLLEGKQGNLVFLIIIIKMKLDILKNQWLDIVFEGRNKTYRSL